MRRYLAMILVSATMLAMHGGKWAAYAWCQVQASLSQQQACDCARVLSTNDGTSQLADSHGVSFNLASELFGTAASSNVLAQPLCKTVAGSSACFYSIAAGTHNLVFRPPAQHLIA